MGFRYFALVLLTILGNCTCSKDYDFLSFGSRSLQQGNTSCTGASQGFSTGQCIPYPADGYCSSFFTSVFDFDGYDFGAVESQLAEQFKQAALILSLTGNRDCFLRALQFSCSNYYYSCEEVDGVAVPKLPCLGTCEDYWLVCENENNAYLQTIVFGAGLSYLDSKIPMCGPQGTFTSTLIPTPPTTDEFGGREIPGIYAYPLGYEGEARYSVNQTTSYELPNGSSIDIQCYDAPLDQTLQAEDSCVFPFVFNIVGEGFTAKAECLLPCPFVTYNEDEYEIMWYFHIIPAVLGFVTSLYVFLDAVLVILKNKNIFSRMKSVLNMQSGSSGSSKGSRHGSKSEEVSVAKKQLQSVTYYALIGSCCALCYFALGPWIVLFESTEYDLGCPVSGSISAKDTLEDYDENSLCNVNRASFCFLQLNLNVILYAICSVHMTITKKFGSTTSQNNIKKIALLVYCICTPIITTSLSFYYDDPGYAEGNNKVFVNLSRWSILCGPRLSFALEFVLVHLPLSLSAAIIFVLSGHTYYVMKKTRAALLSENPKRHGSKNNILSRMRRKSGKPKKSKLSRTEMALFVFRRRLIVLGMCCGIFIVVYVAANLLILPDFDSLGLKLYTWFTCNVNKDVCVSCIFPDESEVPSAGLVAVQYACLSMAPSLFGIFFCSLALERRSREKYLAKTSSHGNENLSKLHSKESKIIMPSTEFSAAANTQTEDFEFQNKHYSTPRDEPIAPPNEDML